MSTLPQHRKGYLHQNNFWKIYQENVAPLYT